MCFSFFKKSFITFPYQKNLSGAYFPVIRFQVYKGPALIDIFALVDSGASISIFRPEVAELLGIEIEDGDKIDLGGVGGKITGYLHRLYIIIANKKLFIPVVFSKSYDISFNLLGREKVFGNFKICFEEKKKTVVLS